MIRGKHSILEKALGVKILSLLISVLHIYDVLEGFSFFPRSLGHAWRIELQTKSKKLLPDVIQSKNI